MDYSIIIRSKEPIPYAQILFDESLGVFIEEEGQFVIKSHTVVGRRSNKSGVWFTTINVDSVRLAEPRDVAKRALNMREWIEFNDQVNDWLDTHDFEADVRNEKYIIRKGVSRRVTYTTNDMHGSEDEWETLIDRHNSSVSHADD